MSPLRLIILAVAAGAAIVAAMLVRNLSGTTTTEQVVVEKKVEVAAAKVLVTNRDLAVGELLTPEDLTWIKWPSANLNLNFYTEEAWPTAIEDVTGSVVRTPFFESEPILPQKIVQKGETGYMAALLTPGMRAISVEISAESASGGFILPNDKVDVILSYVDENAGEDGSEITVTILENVRVLAIDQTFRSTEAGESAVGRVATLELSLDDSELIALASRRGRLTLALRSLGDALAAGDTVISRRELFEIPEPGSLREGQVVVYRQGQPTVTEVGGAGS